jgi:hypothetical protein
MDVDLPAPFDSRYRDILKKFDEIKDTYAYYADETIPTDREYARQILQFLIDVLDNMEINHQKLELDAWAQFLHLFPDDFGYGDCQQDHNYLAFDELDLITNLQKFDPESPPSILQISSIRKKLEKALPLFQQV